MYFHYISVNVLIVQYGYFVFLFHVHDNSIVRSGRPVVVPIECPTKTMAPLATSETESLRSQNRHCLLVYIYHQSDTSYFIKRIDNLTYNKRNANLQQVCPK